MFKIVRTLKLSSLHVNIGDLIKIGSETYEVSDIKLASGELLVFGYATESLSGDSLPLFFMRNLKGHISSGAVVILDTENKRVNNDIQD